MWLSIVEEAVERAVDVVVIAGDIIDRRNSYFEAYGDFEAGLKKLTGAGIPVYVTSGNHDFDVIPELLTNLSDYDINQLGKKGDWEAVLVEKDGVPAVRLVGWSFPSQHVDYNPLDQLDLKFTDDLPVIGVLHGDVGRPNSRYAPIKIPNLKRLGYDGWFIGHIHNPDLRSSSDPVVLIPGTPQPLDPTEPGLHGPWVLTVDNGGIARIDQLPLANLRYEKVSIDTGKMDGLAEIPGEFYGKTDDLIDNESHPALQLLVATLELRGRTDLYVELEEIKDQLVEDLSRGSGDKRITIPSVINQTLPPINLEEIARGHNPPAVLAELLLKLERGKEDELPDDLVKRTQDTLTDAYYANAYKVLRAHGETSPPEKEVSLEILKRQGWKVLDSLLSQTKT